MLGYSASWQHVGIARSGEGEDLKIDDLVLESGLTIAEVHVPQTNESVVKAQRQHLWQIVVKAYSPLS